jgi:hypothetical protein
MSVLVCVLSRVWMVTLAVIATSSTIAAVQAQPAGGRVVVETNAPAAAVRLDGRPVGTAAEGPFAVRAGEVAVEIAEADVAAWAPRRAATVVTVGEGETVTVALDLPVRYRIETFPVGAEVVLEGEGGTERLGTAPLVLDRAEPLRGTLVAEAPGFMPARVAPGDSLTNWLTLVLRPLEAGAVPETASGWLPDRRPNRWIDYALGAAAVGAAAVAVHYKFQADDVDDRYRLPGSAERGDPSLKAEAERLDGYALAALGVMQVSLGVLAVRFVLR